MEINRCDFAIEPQVTIIIISFEKYYPISFLDFRQWEHLACDANCVNINDVLNHDYTEYIVCKCVIIPPPVANLASVINTTGLSFCVPGAHVILSFKNQLPSH